MNPHGFLRSRRSIRHFKPERVPRSVIRRFITTATYAPSAHNRQPWRFAVITKPTAKTALADAMAKKFRRDLLRNGLEKPDVEHQIKTSRARITAAPVVIALCMDVSDMDAYPDPRRAAAERIMAIQSTANAGLALLFAVHAEDLGGVWMCSPLFAPEAVRRVLHLPRAWEPQALFLIGPQDEVPRPKRRKPLKDVVVFA
jgi:F420 biosynthesis protein FbiB-like protein